MTEFSKNSKIKSLQYELLSILIGLVRATEGNEFLITDQTNDIIKNGLLNLYIEDVSLLNKLIVQANNEKKRIVPNCFTCAIPCGRTTNYDVSILDNTLDEIRNIKLELITKIHFYTHKTNCDLNIIYKSLYAFGMDDWGIEDIKAIINEIK